MRRRWTWAAGAALLAVTTPALAEDPSESPVPDSSGAPVPLATEPVAPEPTRPKVSVNLGIDVEARLQEYDPAPLVHVGGAKPRFVEQVGRLTGRISRDKLRFDFQLDQLAFVGLPHTVDGESTSKPPPMQFGCGLPSCVGFKVSDGLYVNPEKLALLYTAPKLEVTLGDFYEAFGTGVVLNINRNVDVDIDTSIQGGRVVAKPGDWEITGLAGMMNRQQVFQDNPNVRLLRGDKRHLIAGARVERYGLGKAAIGAHGMMLSYVDDFGIQGPLARTSATPDVVAGGATVDLYSVGGIDWKFEVDGLSFPTERLFTNETRAPGYGAYSSASFALGSTLWLVEAKRYKNVYRLNNPVAQEIYVIVAPPTLEYERAINPDTAAVTSSNDISGVSARMDILAGAATPFVALSVHRDADMANTTQHSPTPETILVAQGGVEWLAEHQALMINAQGRLDRRDDGFLADRQLYADVDFKTTLVGTSSMNVVLIGQRFAAGDQEEGYVPDPWSMVSFSASFLPRPDIGLTGFLDYNNNPIANNGGNLWGPYGYGAVELFLKPASAWTVRLFHGGYAQGLRCSGGQCRIVPAFTGTRVAVTGAF